jgi:hypothetical protein
METAMHYKLTEEIIKLSVSTKWDSAKLEWHFENAYESEEPQTCLCSHFPIINICVIKNKKNNLTTEVGNCCINKFLGIEEGNKIFTSIKRLKNDPTRSMGIDAIEYLKKKRILNDFEYEFYNDIHKKRNLSEKQLEIKKRINKKLIDFTKYESNSAFSRINLVLEWAKTKPNFDITFVKSLKNSCERTGSLTEKQNDALEKIITKWKIDKK